MSEILHVAAAAALLIGAAFSLSAALGLVRFPDLYTRVHASSKAGVVGAGFILLAIALISLDIAIVLRAIAAIVFLLLTTPISAHLLARSAYISGVRPNDITKTNEIID